MDLETIQQMWGKDSKIDDVMLDESSLRIPQLHHKYLTLHNEYTLLMKKARQQLKVMHHKKWLYYSGKEVPDDAEPFPYKVIKSDIQNWIGVDDDIMKIEMKIDYYDVVISTLSDILKQVHQMTYHVKQCIEWRRFVNGV